MDNHSPTVTFRNSVYHVPTHILVMSGSKRNVGGFVHCNV